MRVRRIALATAVALGLAGLGATSPAFADGADGFADRTAIGVPATASGDTTGATRETGEPRNPCASAGASFWFSLTATEDARVQLSTKGSSFDTVLAVYTGDDLSTLRAVACNDDHAGYLYSQVQLDVVAGASYAIQLSGYEYLPGLPQSGSFKLSTEVVVPPPAPSPDPDPVAGGSNDLFADATELTGRDVTVAGDLTDMTVEAGEPRYCADPEWDYPGTEIASSVWYRYTGVTDGAVIIDVTPATGWYRPLLEVFSGTDLTSLQQLECGWISPGELGLDPGGAIYVRLALRPDDTYTSPAFSLRIRHLDAPANDDFASALTLAAVGNEDRRSVLGATIEAGEPYAYYGTVWYRHTAVKDEPLVVSTNRSDSNTSVAVYTGTGLDDLEIMSSGYTTAATSEEASAGWLATAGETYWIQVLMYASPSYPSNDVDVVLMRGVAAGLFAGVIVADGGDRHETGAGVNGIFVGGGVVLSQDDSDGDVVDACVYALFGVCVDDQPVPTTPRRPAFPE